MKTKLTLRLEGEVIERAKAYATRRGTSVSGLVEDYFRVVASAPARRDGAEASGASRDGAEPDWQAGLGPRVRELLDRPAPSAQVGEDDYKRYLETKYA